jgi:copper oxidase (laccase) domain-containing protein
MLERFRRPPAFFFGPCIGPCCYAVDEARYDRLHDAFPAGVFTRRQDKIYMDLRAANRHLLKGARELAALDLCTCCHPELFHSYRRDGDKAGRNYAVIGRIPSREVL